MNEQKEVRGFSVPQKALLAAALLLGACVLASAIAAIIGILFPSLPLSFRVTVGICATLLVALEQALKYWGWLYVPSQIIALAVVAAWLPAVISIGGGELFTFLLMLIYLFGRYYFAHDEWREKQRKKENR